MFVRPQSLIALALAFSASATALSADLLTIEEAQAKSKETGRPILAMGGSKT
ncbi:MAG TPA: hypothetical protein VFB80_00495 [Pirellulaceae bacterium]|nr:hypothetical protein [Pirellulaceae bacterium]